MAVLFSWLPSPTALQEQAAKLTDIHSALG
jgi:hypothetical protein